MAEAHPPGTPPDKGAASWQPGASSSQAFCGPGGLGVEQGRSQALLGFTLSPTCTPPGTHQAQVEERTTRETVDGYGEQRGSTSTQVLAVPSQDMQ